MVYWLDNMIQNEQRDFAKVPQFKALTVALSLRFIRANYLPICSSLREICIVENASRCNKERVSVQNYWRHPYHGLLTDQNPSDVIHELHIPKIYFAYLLTTRFQNYYAGLIGIIMVACFMMTSSNGKVFRVTGLLCGEFNGHRWIPRTKASGAELWCFLWSAHV